MQVKIVYLSWKIVILAVYNASEKETNLNIYHYQCFAKNVSNNKNVLLGLPPSEAATREPFFECTTKFKRGSEIRNRQKNGAGQKQMIFIAYTNTSLSDS